MDRAQTDLLLHPLVDRFSCLRPFWRFCDGLHVACPRRVHGIGPAMPAVVQIHESQERLLVTWWCDVEGLSRPQLHPRHEEVQLHATCVQMAHPQHPIAVMGQARASEGLERLHHLALLRFCRGILGGKAQHPGLVSPAMRHRVYEVDHALWVPLQNLGSDRAAHTLDPASRVALGLAILVVVYHHLLDKVLHRRSGLALTMVEELDHHRQLQCRCASLPSFRSMATSRLRIARRSR